MVRAAYTVVFGFCLGVAASATTILPSLDNPAPGAEQGAVNGTETGIALDGTADPGIGIIDGADQFNFVDTAITFLQDDAGNPILFTETGSGAGAPLVEDSGSFDSAAAPIGSPEPGVTVLLLSGAALLILRRETAKLQ
jgi:hypothetical protein